MSKLEAFIKDVKVRNDKFKAFPNSYLVYLWLAFAFLASAFVIYTSQVRILLSTDDKHTLSFIIATGGIGWVMATYHFYQYRKLSKKVNNVS